MREHNYFRTYSHPGNRYLQYKRPTCRRMGFAIRRMGFAIRRMGFAIRRALVHGFFTEEIYWICNTTYCMTRSVYDL